MAPFRWGAIVVALGSSSAVAQVTSRMSVNSSGVQGNGDSYGPVATSADGQVVAFASLARNLVAGDTNKNWDVFVHDRSTGVTERVSVDSAGAQVTGASDLPAISADGRFVAFHSDAAGLVAGDNNGVADVFVHDRVTGATERVSVDSSGVEAGDLSGAPSISADGRFVAFASSASNLVAGDTNVVPDIFVHDRTTGVTERVSLDSAGGEANDHCEWGEISADGQSVAFGSLASNLVAVDSNGVFDIFVHDRTTGLTERVNVDSSGAEANHDGYFPALSADGRFIAFESYASNLVAGDLNGQNDIFVHDRSTGVTERVSVDSSGAEANHSCFDASLSADGQRVSFYSDASNLVAGDTNGWGDVFVHDRLGGFTERVSVAASGTQGNGLSTVGTLSADGKVVVFSGWADNLVAGDTNKSADVFVHEGPAATWSNYGAGFPGTHGVPAFTSQQPPVLGSTITVDAANSYANPTIGLLLVGFQQATLHTRWGGDLLVVPALALPISFSFGGDSFTGAIPLDPRLAGFRVDLQALELDPGAAQGVSFTAGLELVLGN